MQRLKKVLLTLFFALLMLMILRVVPQQNKVPSPKAAQVPDGAHALVVRVIDGDTVKVRLRNTGEIATIRLLGIDCPESRNNTKCQRDGKHGRHGCRWQLPHGKIAKEQSMRLLHNATITLECGKKCRKGSYGRFLRYIRLSNGLDFGQEMIRRGLCEDFAWKYPHLRQSSYKRTQTMAKYSRRGIWR